MKKNLAFILVVLMLAAPLLAQAKNEPPAVFKGLQIQFTAMSWCDFTLTTWALKTGRYEEANPIAKFYVHHTAIAIPVLVVADLGVHWGLTKIYKMDRTVAWVMLILLDITRAWVLYHNLRLAR